MTPQYFHIGAVPKIRGVHVRVVIAAYRGAVRLDVREYEERRLRDPDSSEPTGRGIDLPVAELPKLLAAVRAAEASAIAEGVLQVRQPRLSPPFPPVGRPPLPW